MKMKTKSKCRYCKDDLLTFEERQAFELEDFKARQAFEVERLAKLEKLLGDKRVSHLCLEIAPEVELMPYGETKEVLAL